MARKASVTDSPARSARSAGSSGSSGSSVADNREARLARSWPGRYAIVRAFDAGDAGGARDEIIDIKQMEPGTRPELPGVEDEASDHADRYSVEEVPAGVIIGMRRGGEYQAVAGFGWRDAADYAAHGSPIGSGSARLSDMS